MMWILSTALVILGVMLDDSLMIATSDYVSLDAARETSSFASLCFSGEVLLDLRVILHDSQIAIVPLMASLYGHMVRDKTFSDLN